ncbi:MAG: HisA/HisF-related TIM barrel protein [Thermoleophilaceae bacterium]
MERDGMLEGIDAEEVRRIAGAVRGRFLYSGGVGSSTTCTRWWRCARSTSRG